MAITRLKMGYISGLGMLKKFFAGNSRFSWEVRNSRKQLVIFLWFYLLHLFHPKIERKKAGKLFLFQYFLKAIVCFKKLNTSLISLLIAMFFYDHFFCHRLVDIFIVFNNA